MDFRGDPEVLDILAAAGADVIGERVRFEAGMCREIIQATALRDFIQHARNPANTVQIGGASAVFSTVGGPPFVHDIDQGRRYATTEDHLNLLKIGHMLPTLHATGGPCELMDVPIPERHLHGIYSRIPQVTDPSDAVSV